jgi:hypothetical protein
MSIVPTIMILTFINIDWKKQVVVNLQLVLPINIWIGVMLNTLLHPLMVWLLPGSYGRWTEYTRQQREEALVAGIKGTNVDIEALGQGENDGETPLTGRGFVRDRNGALVENPVTQVQARDLYEEMRS